MLHHPLEFPGESDSHLVMWTLCDPIGYTVHGILQARILEWVTQLFPSSRDLPNPGIKPRSPALQADSLPAKPPGKPKNTGVGSLSPGDLPNPGIELGSLALQVDSLPAEPQGKTKNTELGKLSFLQWIFPTQELNWGLLLCRRILYQLSYKGSHLLTM